MPRRHDRRHSVAQPSSPSRLPIQRSLSAPFSQYSSPPSQQAPWRTSEGGQSHSQPGVDYFNYPPTTNIQRPASPFSITSIPEEDDSPRIQSPDTKSSPYLRPPEQRFGKHKVPGAPSLHLDTSDGTLVSSPLVISRESSVPGSPLGFRDVQEDGSLSSSIYRRNYQWWPSFLSPEPHFLYITLFPTVRGFRSKPWLDKILSIIAIPAVLCLVITLPVVDTESIETEGEIKLPYGPLSPGILESPVPDGSSDIRMFSPVDNQVLVPRSWNRWLTGVQCIFAPLFMTFIFFRIHCFLRGL